MIIGLFPGDHDHLVAVIGIDSFQDGLHGIGKRIKTESSPPHIGKPDHAQISFQNSITENDHVPVEGKRLFDIRRADVAHLDGFFVVHQKAGIRVGAARRHLAQQQLDDAEKGADVRSQQDEASVRLQDPPAFQNEAAAVGQVFQNR